MGVVTFSQQKQLSPPQPEKKSGHPPLNSGDRLTRTEFHRRYLLHPEIKLAELIEGVVYVASPTRASQHGNPHYNIVTWLGTYQANTFGVQGSNNATLLLDYENEVQPDALLHVEPALGGRSYVNEDDYFEGAPELVVEVAASYDLHDKRRAYARNGVQEYIVLQMYEKKVAWFALREGIYEPLPPDEKGILHSEVFPGLWLQTDALWTGDVAAQLAVLQEGMASPGHAAFVEKLKQLELEEHRGNQ